MTERIQFREDPAVVAFVRDRGLNPNELARAAFEAEVKRLKADDWLERIRALGVRGLDGDRIVADLRELRDT